MGRAFNCQYINDWLVLLFQTHACAVIIAGVCLFVTESFWNFAMSATVILSYSVQNFKTIWLNEKSFGPTKFNEIWANKVLTVKTGTFDVSITDRCSSEEILQVPQGISSAIFNYVDGSVNWIQINMKRKTTCLTLYSTLWLLMAYSIMRCYAICRDSEYLLRTQYIMMRKWLLLSPAPFPSCRNVTLGHVLQFTWRSVSPCVSSHIG